MMSSPEVEAEVVVEAAEAGSVEAEAEVVEVGSAEEAGAVFEAAVVFGAEVAAGFAAAGFAVAARVASVADRLAVLAADRREVMAVLAAAVDSAAPAAAAAEVTAADRDRLRAALEQEACNAARRVEARVRGLIRLIPAPRAAAHRVAAYREVEAQIGILPTPPDRTREHHAQAEIGQPARRILHGVCEHREARRKTQSAGE